jgi:hypothetical protein
MSASEEEYVRWTSEQRIPVPIDEYMLVPTRDFRRIRKRVSDELQPRTDAWSAAYCALFGAAVSTFAAVPPLMTSRSLATWIIPTFIVSGLAFVALGAALLIIDRKLASGRRRKADEIAKEMSDLIRTHRRLPTSGSDGPEN